jgi:hypothetical protein
MVMLNLQTATAFYNRIVFDERVSWLSCIRMNNNFFDRIKPSAGFEWFGGESVIVPRLLANQSANQFLSHDCLLGSLYQKAGAFSRSPFEVSHHVHHTENDIHQDGRNTVNEPAKQHTKHSR